MELNAQERISLEVFTSDAGAFEVVHKIVKEHIEKKRDLYIKSPLLLKGKSNEEIGAKFNAFLEGIDLVEGIFREIGQHRKPKEEKEEKNPAR